ncbi:vam6/Vps39-like protein [Oscarella lobularis]|uniref:vam6/Vps39-like protein n=1 Tax=Oscarella lobularis TaxID=121494 RepID=UPI0033136A35
MSDAFDCIAVVEKLPIQIESIATFGSTLLVGTRKGHLILYEVANSDDPTGKHKVTLKKTNKNFATKPIVQLTVVEELNIIISLSDSIVSVHDLDTFGLRFRLTKTQGAVVFNADLKVHRPRGAPVPKYQLRLAVSVRRRIELFEWRDNTFQDLLFDLNLPDTAKTIAWCSDSIAVGFRKEYCIIKTQTGKLIELFPTGKNDPLVSSLPNGRLALVKDEMSVIVNSDGKPTQKHATMWSESPSVMEYYKPYMIAILSPSAGLVEIRTIDPKHLVQTISVTLPKYLAIGRAIYIASSHTIWRLVPKSLQAQIEQFMVANQYELSLQLAEMIEDDDSGVDKEDYVQEIQYKFALHLFAQHRFEDSLKRFAGLDTDPREVIGLFPSLLPKAAVQKQSEFRAPVLAGQELEKGYLALIEYLLDKRHMLGKMKDTELDAERAQHQRTMNEIIDTTLLKCYVQVNERLVGPLLKHHDNNCHLQESERTLTKFEKWSELVLLYSSKKEHGKALKLLLEKAHSKSGPLSGPSRTIEYLQSLGPEHLDLIFEYSKWILQKYPSEGLKIFIVRNEDPRSKAEPLPVDKVVAYLKDFNREIAIRYLEHVINDWKDQRSELHNNLILLYLAEAKGGGRKAEEFRRQLMVFLEKSECYKAAPLIKDFPRDYLLERALLLGKLGRHEAALRIYALELKDESKAEEYCRRKYRQGSASEDVYLALFRMYLGLENDDSSVSVGEPNIIAALQVLTKHHQYIDTPKALAVLPKETELKKVRSFLEKVIEQQAMQWRHGQVLKSLRHAELLQVHQQRMQIESSRVLVTDEHLCSSCRKRLQTSAFARHPDGTIEHYWCYEKKLKDSTAK